MQLRCCLPEPSVEQYTNRSGSYTTNTVFGTVKSFVHRSTVNKDNVRLIMFFQSVLCKIKTCKHLIKLIVFLL